MLGVSRPLRTCHSQLCNYYNYHQCRYIVLNDLPTFDKNPTIHINLSQYNAKIDILTLSHWVDIQYFEQNKINQQCSSLYQWLNDKSPTHILLDICPNRLNYIYKYNKNNIKPNEITMEEIDDILEISSSGSTHDEEEIYEHFDKLKKQTKKMKRFTEKVDRLDEIHKLQLINSANKVEANKILNQYKLTEPIFTETDIWYFEFYWNLFEKYFKNLIPYFDEFKKEFYLNSNKFRFLNIIYGEEIAIILNYFDPNNKITNYNLDNLYKYNFPKIRGIHSNKTEFDDFMDKHCNDDDTLMIKYGDNDNNNNCKLVAGGMPIEFIYRKLQKLKKPMLWIEFAMSIKNYFSDKHAQNLANQIPLICDIKEFIWTPHARKIKYNSWDSTLELNEMISCVSPQFYDIFIKQQSKYLFNNLLKILLSQQSLLVNNKQQKTNIVIVTGQGTAQGLNDFIAKNLVTTK